MRLSSEQLVGKYLPELRLLKDQATKACGSRYTVSPTHNASRRYTELVAEYVDSGGSLLRLADALGVSYSSLHRRATTKVIKPVPRKPASVRTDTEHKDRAQHLKLMSIMGTQEEYYKEIKSAYDDGYSMNKLAHHMDQSSAYPLYYALKTIEKSDMVVKSKKRSEL